MAGDAVGSSPTVGNVIVGLCDVFNDSLKCTVSVKFAVPTSASAIFVKFGVRLTTLGSSVSTLKTLVMVAASTAPPPAS